MPHFKALYYPNYSPSPYMLKQYLFVFDSIHAIVPEEVIEELDEFTHRLNDKIPNSFIPDPPTDNDLSFVDFNRDRLEKAFEIIKKRENEESHFSSSKSRSKTIKANIVVRKGQPLFEFTPEKFEMFIHERKVTDNVLDLLKEHNLIHLTNKQYTKGFSRKDYFVVNEEAGSLILSLIADNIAKRKCLHTITDKKLDFTLNSMNAISDQNIRGTLAGALLEVEIPSTLKFVSLNNYSEIRKNHTEVRIAFQQMLADIENLYQLNHIETSEQLENIILDVTKDFQREMSKFKKSKSIQQKITKWERLPLASLMNLGANFLSEDLLTKILVGSLSVLIEIAQRNHDENPSPTSKDNVYRYLTSIKRDVRFAVRKQALEGSRKSGLPFKEYLRQLNKLA